jgi:hypothetical protein
VVPVTVVVAFYSRCGSTETRALTAAVGAVNARALIRMRRLADVTRPRRSAEAGCAETLARMRKEYVPPTEVDIVGADALVLAVPEGATPESPEWAPLAGILTGLAAKERLHGKVAAVLAGGHEAATVAFAAFLHQQGLVIVPPGAVSAGADVSDLARARAHGRLVAEVSRAIKARVVSPK